MNNSQIINGLIIINHSLIIISVYLLTKFVSILPIIIIIMIHFSQYGYMSLENCIVFYF